MRVERIGYFVKLRMALNRHRNAKKSLMDAENLAASILAICDGRPPRKTKPTKFFTARPIVASAKVDPN
nr:hypothetical protein [Mesorhizobium sp. ESP-6-2]